MRKSSIDQDILFEDNHLIVLNKQASDIVQGDITGDAPLSDILKQYIKTKYQKPGDVFLGVVHRLDRPVSGAVIFARTSKALSRLNIMLRDGEISKTYWAIVKNPPPQQEGDLTNYLKRNEEKNKSFVVEKKMAGAQQASLHYRVIDQSDRYYLLEVKLLTGRHHQIRVQLSALGCPIKGDLKYGYPRSNPGGFIHLHARRLEFTHPVRKEPVVIYAPVPDDPLWRFFQERNSPQPLKS
ncbi:MAG: RluA family pseudouridine synthase [Bacteroidales bacterium]|nr:RluA family pseudouridine synthase [Bacteroidales bacterium]